MAVYSSVVVVVLSCDESYAVRIWLILYSTELCMYYMVTLYSVKCKLLISIAVLLNYKHDCACFFFSMCARCKRSRASSFMLFASG